MQMHVGMDISAIQYGRGVSRYTSNLIRALYKRKKEIALRLIGTSLRQKDVLSQFVRTTTPNAYSKILPYPVKVMNVLWNDFHLFSPEMFLGKLDVFHSWEMQPPLQKAALVTTIHDLAMLRFPKTADPYVLSMNQKSWKHAKKEAKAIIAVSQATKNDIVEFLQIDPEKVYVVYEAQTEETKITLSPERQKEIVDGYLLTRPFALFVGTLEPRKNLHRVIEAWRPLKKDLDLVLVGAAGWEIVQNEKGLHLLGVISNEDLIALQQKAEVLLYASLYEGFGLPILDAFYHGLPVVTSNNSGMAEVAGDAAVTVDPIHTSSIRRGIEEALQHKHELVKKGQQRLKYFSWDKAAKQTIEVYRKASER